MDHASAAAHRLPQQEGSGSSRLFNTLAYVFAKQEPNAPTPPPPQHLVDIAAQTLYFATAGGLAQGLVQYLHERRRAGAPTSPSLYTQRKHAFQNVSSAIIRGLTRTGALAFLYFTTVGHLNPKAARSLQHSPEHSPGRPPFLRPLVPSFSRSLVRQELATAIYRDEYDTETYFNTLCGGIVAGGFLGTLGQRLTPVPLLLRMKGGVFGAALGGLCGFPVGMLQDALVVQLPEDEREQRRLQVSQMRLIASGEMDAVRGREIVMEMERRERREMGERVGRIDVADVIRAIERGASSRAARRERRAAAEEEEENREARSKSKWWHWRRKHAPSE